MGVIESENMHLSVSPVAMYVQALLCTCGPYSPTQLGATLEYKYICMYIRVHALAIRGGYVERKS